jgi:hypothetical protein
MSRLAANALSTTTSKERVKLNKFKNLSKADYAQRAISTFSPLARFFRVV